MAIFGGESGCRCGEILALTWSDINFTTGDVSISKSLAQTKTRLFVKKTKTNKARIARIGHETLAVLRQHRQMIDREKELFGADYRDNDLVFCTPEGSFLRPKQVSGRMSQFMREAGIQKSLHKLRHFCASVRLSSGESVPAVAAHLGHDPNVLLKVYAHLMPGDRERGVSLWKQAMSEMAQKPVPEPPSAVLVMPEKKREHESAAKKIRSTGGSTGRLRLVSSSK